MPRAASTRCYLIIEVMGKVKAKRATKTVCTLMVMLRSITLLVIGASNLDESFSMANPSEPLLQPTWLSGIAAVRSFWNPD